jgi:hypothetical protein
MNAVHYLFFKVIATIGLGISTHGCIEQTSFSLLKSMDPEYQNIFQNPEISSAFLVKKFFSHHH